MLNLLHRTKKKSRTKYCNFIVIYIYSKPEDWSSNLDELSFNLIDAHTTAKLERSFEDEKDLQALKSLKAPGPYGFSVTFFQTWWIIVKDNVMELFQNVHEKDMFEKSLKATSIALISIIIIK